MNDAEDDDVGATKLAPADEQYTAYVGPPEEYDFMGATQFRLLTTLGLRDHHSLLDFGCGSLRAGRLLIPYLLPGRYYGLEPNRWLVDAGIEKQIGRSMLELKRPTFLYHSDFSATRFGVTFDYIVAQSIFSHAGREIIAKSLSEFHACLATSGLVLATFVQPHQLDNTAEYGGMGWLSRLRHLQTRHNTVACARCRPIRPAAALVPSPPDVVRPRPFGRSTAHCRRRHPPDRGRSARARASPISQRLTGQQSSIKVQPRRSSLLRCFQKRSQAPISRWIGQASIHRRRKSFDVG